LQLAAAAVEPSVCARLKCFGLPHAEGLPMNPRHQFGLVAVVCTLVALAAAPLRTQPLPSTVRIVFPFVPGGFGNAPSRLVGDQMSGALGTTVIIENRSGGARLGGGLGVGGKLARLIPGAHSD
jgi:tripartite-type tricarboxylate transporter receptor subunit TctC